MAHAWGGVTAGETTYFIDYLTDTIKVMLLTSSASAALSQDTNEFISTLITYEVAASGTYATRGVTLTNKTLALSTPMFKFDADDISLTGVTWADVRYAIIYKDSGSDSTSPLMGYVDFGVTYNPKNAPMTITWGTDGLLTISPA
jgi:hypothetical protein